MKRSATSHWRRPSGTDKLECDERFTELLTSKLRRMKWFCVEGGVLGVRPSQRQGHRSTASKNTSSAFLAVKDACKGPLVHPRVFPMSRRSSRLADARLRATERAESAAEVPQLPTELLVLIAEALVTRGAKATLATFIRASRQFLIAGLPALLHTLDFEAEFNTTRLDNE